MTADTLLTDIAPRGVASLTLNRPERGNAYDQPLLAALTAEIARLGTDAAIRVIVLRGAGKHFCAGADIGGARGAAPAARRPPPPGPLLRHAHVPEAGGAGGHRARLRGRACGCAGR